MLTTFVIGLREGLEASLIVGIVAAFLNRHSDRRALRWMWVGVASAVAVCAGAAMALNLAGRSMSLRGRETMEGALSLVAVAGVSYMVVWMTRHAATLRVDLEGRAREAVAERSAMALVAMAFLAVIREGLETAIFLLATLGRTGSLVGGAVGALAGVVVAVSIGYGIYRGGVRIDLGRFLRVTGVLLVLVAAGLVLSAVHEFSEAGLVRVGTRPAIDLSWLVAPGTVRGGLIAGFLGLQPVPTYVEIVAWLAFLVPMVWFVTRPARNRRILPAPTG